MALGYLGNDKLKAIGISTEWTPEMVQEYARCAEDPVYFARQYIKIVHPDHGFVPLDMYDFQEKIVDTFVKNRRTIVLASRQVGKTTTAVALLLHYILFNEYKTVAVLANKGDSAREVISRIKLAYEALPKWIQHGILEWNKGSIELENGCKVFAGSTTSSSIRGKTISLLYVDECAFIEGWDEFFQSVFPTISSGKTTKLFFTSTPNGLNHYFHLWKGAEAGLNGYVPIKVRWEEVPGRDEAWKKEQLEIINHDMQKWRQEFDIEFLGSSGTLISGECLGSMAKMVPIYSTDDGFKQYIAPVKGRQYTLVADVSRGKGLDYSAFSVFDVSEAPFVQVATFRSNVTTPPDYASVVHRVSLLYNQAHTLVEINDIGGQVVDLLHMDHGSESLLYTENAGSQGKKITGGFSGKTVERGVRTTRTVKSVGCSLLKLLIEKGELVVNDEETIAELSRFSKKGTSYEAESGAHDDLVMGLVLFAWLSNQAYFKDMIDVNMMQRIRDKTEEEFEESFLPICFFDDGNSADPTEAQIDFAWTHI